MKAGYLLCLLAGAAFCGPVFAQEEDDIDQYFSSIDTGRDDKISVDEMKKFAYADLEADAGARDKLIAWGPHIIDFVLSDADDDRIVTRKEFRAYIAASQQETRVKFSAKDWDFYQKDYLDPYISETMKVADKNGDKALSKEEYNTLSDATPDEFAEVDANDDGKLTGEEYTQTIKKYLKEYYDFEQPGSEPGEPSEELKTRFAGFDADGDGKISVAEWKARTASPDSALADWWGLYLAMLVIDGNNDLGIDLKEFAAFAADQEKGVKPKLYPVDRKAFEDVVWADTDTDKNGTLDRKEYIAVAPEGGDAIYGEEFDGMDVDKDGNVTRDELWESFKQHLGDYEIVKEEAGADSDDPTWELYRKVGRSWTHRMTSNYAGVESVSHMRYEVIKVEKDHSVITITMLDKDKKPVAGLKAREAKILFKSGNGAAEGNAEVKDLGEKKVTVGAGEYTCKGTEVTVETSTGKSVTTSWTHAKLPALLVRSESKTDDGSSVIELVEFHELGE